VFGGSAVANGKPRVTQTIVVICVLVYLAQQASSEVSDRFLYAPFMTVAEPWRMITSAFLHSPTYTPFSARENRMR
jgi:membrane associated rhomboid family serine protease